MVGQHGRGQGWVAGVTSTVQGQLPAAGLSAGDLCWAPGERRAQPRAETSFPCVLFRLLISDMKSCDDFSSRHKALFQLC